MGLRFKQLAVPIDEVNLDDMVQIMTDLFQQTGDICSVSELLDALKLQGRLVPSVLHFPDEWEELYEEVVDVVE